MTTTDAARVTATPLPSSDTSHRDVGIADAGPWGILAFATVSFMLGVFNADILGAAAAAIVIPVAFVFGGGIQIVVAVLEIFRGNLFGAAVFGSFGPFWLMYALIEERYGAKLAAAGAAAKDANAVADGLTLFLIVFAVLCAIFTFAALKTDIVLTVIIALVFVALVLLAIGTSTGSASLTHASGWVTLVFAVLGWYRAGIMIVAATFGREVFWRGPLA